MQSAWIPKLSFKKKKKKLSVLTPYFTFYLYNLLLGLVFISFCGFKQFCTLFVVFVCGCVRVYVCVAPAHCDPVFIRLALTNSPTPLLPLTLFVLLTVNADASVCMYNRYILLSAI